MSDSECVGWGSEFADGAAPTRNASHFDLPTRGRLRQAVLIFGTPLFFAGNSCANPQTSASMRSGLLPVPS